MPSIPMPPGIANDVEKKMVQVWDAVFSLHRSDPFLSIRELLSSIVIDVNKRAMSEKAKLRQFRSDSRRRSLTDSGRRSLTDSSKKPLTNSTDEKGDEVDDYPLPTLGRRTTTGLNLSSFASPSSRDVLKRTGSAGANSFSLTPNALSPRKGNQTFPNLDAEPVEEYFYPESKLFEWKKVAFREGADDEMLDPLSDKGAMHKYRKTRNSIMHQKSHLLKESYAVLAERPVMSSMSQYPYAYDESDAAAGIENEADLKKEAFHLQQVALLRNNGAGSTSLLCFHPYEPALVVCGNSDNVSVWNAETFNRSVVFSNGNPKSTRVTSCRWINEASTSLLLTGSGDGTVRIFDVSTFVGCFLLVSDVSHQLISFIWKGSI